MVGSLGVSLACVSDGGVGNLELVGDLVVGPPCVEKGHYFGAVVGLLLFETRPFGGDVP